jgi:hypothetical protein
MMGAGGSGMTSEDLRTIGRVSALVESEPEGLGRAGGYECSIKQVMSIGSQRIFV